MSVPMKLTRRQILTGAALAAAAGGANGVGRQVSALASVTVGPRGERKGCDTLVALFLRGGADGLNIVVPHGDDDYYRLRPTLSLPRPNDRGSAVKARVLDLDGFFGLHPALAPLLPIYQAGELAVVHAVGSGDQTRSHFEAMATMERGLARQSGAASGWLARHLASTAEDGESPLRAIAVSETMPDSLRGATNATALRSLSDFRLIAPDTLPTGSGGKAFHADYRTAAVTESLRSLYSKAPNPSLQSVVGAGRESLAAMEAVRRLDPAHYRPDPNAKYPDNDLGNGFRQVACLVKGGVGLEVACLDMGGWDTHVAQGRDAGWQPALLGDLGRALAAFTTDIGPKIANVTIIVMTEFGRRAYENSGLGTDHGRAGMMLLAGGGVVGGKVYAQWPGLAAEKLEEPGDLRVTTDYRDVLAEVLAKRLRNESLGDVFPDYTPRFGGLLKA